MKRRLFFAGLALALVLIALAGWTADGARWAFTASRRRRPRLAPARA